MRYERDQDHKRSKKTLTLARRLVASDRYMEAFLCASVTQSDCFLRSLHFIFKNVQKTIHFKLDIWDKNNYWIFHK